MISMLDTSSTPLLALPLLVEEQHLLLVLAFCGEYGESEEEEEEDMPDTLSSEWHV